MHQKAETDDWLVTLLSSFWHSRDQSAETRGIVESNVDPEEAEIAQGLFSAMPRELHNELQKHNALHLDSLGDELGQYVPALLDELGAGTLLTKSTSSVSYYVRVSPPSEAVKYRICQPCKPLIDVDERGAELQRLLEDDGYADQHENIRKAISLYDEGYVPSADSVLIQKGKVVSIDVKPQVLDYDFLPMVNRTRYY